MHKLVPVCNRHGYAAFCHFFVQPHRLGHNRIIRQVQLSVFIRIPGACALQHHSYQRQVRRIHGQHEFSRLFLYLFCDMQKPLPGQAAHILFRKPRLPDNVQPVKQPDSAIVKRQAVYGAARLADACPAWGKIILGNDAV